MHKVIHGAILAATALIMAGPAPAQLMVAPPRALATPMAAATMPPGYLVGKAAVDILKLLPPPPLQGSAQEVADRAAYAASAAGVDGADWRAAIGQLSPTSPEFTKAVSCALGTQLSLAATPATMTMLARAGVDMIAPMTRAKEAYARPRPFTTDKGRACDPATADGIGARLGYGYPSGHAGIGWLWALILSDIAPARSAALRTFGVATGDLRVACRVHWLSDISSGRILATSVYQRIADLPEYRADLARATAEIAAAPPLACPG